MINMLFVLMWPPFWLVSSIRQLLQNMENAFFSLYYQYRICHISDHQLHILYNRLDCSIYGNLKSSSYPQYSNADIDFIVHPVWLNNGFDESHLSSIDLHNTSISHAHTHANRTDTSIPITLNENTIILFCSSHPLLFGSYTSHTLYNDKKKTCEHSKCVWSTRPSIYI